MRQFVLRLYWKYIVLRRPHRHHRMHDMFEIETTRDMLREVHRHNWK